MTLTLLLVGFPVLLNDLASEAILLAPLAVSYQRGL